MGVILAAIIAYLLSSIPVIQIMVNQTTGAKLDQVGSGNVGVANAFRNAPRWVGIIGVFWQVVLTIGLLATGRFVFQLSQVGLYLMFSGLILGNLYPLFNHFKGSKARTILLWGLLFLNVYLFILAVVVWLLVFTVTKNSPLSVKVQLLIFPAGVWVLEKNLWILVIVLLIEGLLLVNNGSSRDDIGQSVEGDNYEENS